MSKSLNDRIRKMLGDDCVVSGHTRREQNKKGVLSVSPNIDLALGGGVPYGNIVLLYGLAKCGKTTTALTMAANHQKNGGKVYYLDVEGKIENDHLDEGIRDLNLDEDYLTIVQSGKKTLSAEDFLNSAREVIDDDESDSKFLIVIDSVAQLIPMKELNDNIKADRRQQSAKLVAEFIKMTLPQIHRKGHILVCISQGMMSQGLYPKMVAKGGEALKFGSHTIMQSRSKEYVSISGQVSNKQTDKSIGQNVFWYVEKAPNSTPNQKVTSFIRYGIGIDFNREYINMGIESQMIKKTSASSSWYCIPMLDAHLDHPEIKKALNGTTDKPSELFKLQGLEKLQEFFETTPWALDLLKQEIRELHQLLCDMKDSTVEKEH